MSIWGKLFGKDSVIEAGISAGDKLFFTPEEKADYKLMFLKAYEPFKLAQRLIAMTVVPPYVLAWFITFGIRATGRDIAQLLELLSGDMGTIVAIIVTFYFGGGAIEGIVSRFREKSKT